MSTGLRTQPQTPLDASGEDEVRRLIILGATGSIGRQTLAVVEHLNNEYRAGRWNQRYEVVGLAASRSADALARSADRFDVSEIALADEHTPWSAAGTPRRGPDAGEQLVREVDADIVLGAMVGSAGLPATLAALELGRDVALANKETLVAAGTLMLPAARRTGARLLPIDSEHSGVWQCLQGGPKSPVCPPCEPGGLKRVILTASGGPFRTRSAADVYNASPVEALQHPTWDMGPKVTIDSASLTNKALEIIEAHWLFGLAPDQIDVLVHPQSIVHAIVEWSDGSSLAQMGAPDMREPIQYALTWPDRAAPSASPLDWSTIGALEFEEPDHDRFPALRLAYEAIDAGGTAGAVLNAANEAAVEAFLEADGAIPFGWITEVTTEALSAIGVEPVQSLDDVMHADEQARRFVCGQR